MAELVNGNCKNTGSIFRHCALVSGPNLISVEMGIPATPTAGEEGVGQHGAVAIKRIPVIVVTTIEKYCGGKGGN